MNELSTEDFTNNLRRLRDLHGYTQASLAEKVDLNSSTINRWESGQNAPGYKDFFKLMTAFNVSFEELAGIKQASPGEIRKPTPEEALNVLASELGMEIKIVHPFNPVGLMPKDLADKIAKINFQKPEVKVWELIKGVLQGIEGLDDKTDGKSTVRHSS